MREELIEYKGTRGFSYEKAENAQKSAKNEKKVLYLTADDADFLTQILQIIMVDRKRPGWYVGGW